MTKQDERSQDRVIFDEQSPQQNVSWWRRGLVASLVFGLGTIFVVKVAGHYLIQKELIPLVETELNDYLGRPIDIGDLKGFDLNSARFGNTELPATKDNPDRVEVSAVRVNFNLLPLLLQKTLPLNITLVEPNLYIERDTAGVWTPTNFATGEATEGGGIKVNVKQVNLEEGKLTLVGRNSNTKELSEPVTAEFARGVINILDRGDIINFEVNGGNFVEGGKLNVTGKVIGKTIDLDIKAREVSVNEIENLLALPIGLESGTADSDLAIKITDDPIPELRGTAQLKSVDLKVPELETPFTNSNGQLFFNGTKIELDGVKTNFGEVIGTANGSLDLAGEDNFQITAETTPTEADKVLNALKLESPVPIAGKIQTNVKLIGSLDNPVTQVAIATTTPTRIDKTDFQQLRGNLELIGNTLYVRSFRGVPRSGGNITGTGTVQLDGAQNISLNVSGDNVSAKQLARDYQTSLPVDIGSVSGNAVISAQANDPQSFRILDGEGNFPLGDGIVTVNDLQYRSGEWRSQIRASDVRFDSLPFGKDTTETIGEGLINGTFQATGEINDPQLNTLVARGTATVDTVGGRIVAPEIKVADGIWEGDFNTSNLQLRQLFPEVPPEFSDSVSGEFYLTGDVSTPEGEASTIEGRGNLQLAEGTVNVAQLNVTGNEWKAIASANDLELKQLNSATPEQFAGLVNGNFTLSGTIDNITPEGIIARGDGSLTLPEGVFAANNLSIVDGNFTTTIIPQGVDLALFADPNSEDFILEGYLGGELQASGSIDKIDPTAIDAKGTVSFSQGIDLLEQPFTANIEWDGSRLNVLQAKGDALAATGYIELDETFFDAIPDKLAAVDYFNFDVTRASGIDINRLKVPLPSWAINLEKSGIVDFTGEISGIPAQIAIDGNATLRNFNVETLEFDEPLTGTVVVNPDTGVDLALFNNKTLQTSPPTPLLPGEGSNISREEKYQQREEIPAEGRSQTEQITLKLDADFLPQSFTVVNDDLSIEGTGKAEIVELLVSNVPLELIRTIAVKSPDLEVPEKWAVQPIAGEVSGSFTSNLNTLATSGKNVVITSPLLGKIRGNRIVGDFQYANDYISLQNVQFQLGESIYQLTGDVVQQNDDLALEGTVSVDRGEIQDILTALEIFEITDFGNLFGDRNYAKSADLYQPPATPPIEEPLFDIETEDASVWEQLSILAEIQAWLNYREQQRQEDTILPELSNLSGIFAGEIQFNGSLSNGFDAEFAFEGEQWKWITDKNNTEEKEQPIIAEKIVLRGDLQDNILTVLPLIIDLSSGELEPESQIIFSGIFGGEEASGTLALNSIPINLIETVVPIPPEIAFDGVLSATANISGTSDNPQARGEITIANAQINETAILSTSGSFGYDDARLNFSANSIVAEDAEPLTITGSVPYQLPFAQVPPESDRLEVSLNVQNKALTLLNILSRGEVNWIDGQGEVALDISGSYDPDTNTPSDITAQGRAVIDNATIAVQTLPDEYLTEVNSNISFDLDRIAVENFQGNFGGGQISAVGTIPIDRETPQENPLTIDLDEIAIDLKGLYQGGVKGQLQILGQAIEPDITGNVTLFDGTILLSDAAATTPITPQQQQQLGLPAVTEYQNLQLKLGEDIVISQPPIFNFVAEGTLDVEGTFLEPLPEGTINLKRGQINLFTTQLYLAKTEDNTARFTPNNILDPFLDVRLVGSAIETTQNRTPEDPLSSEIEDIPASSFGTIETVRISAEVRGLSSQITNNIVLTSSPPRSQTEILALLGGSFVNTLGRGNSTLGLANLAGSALFGSLNSQFNNAFPIGELRLFPTQIIGEDSESERIDALAGEIAIDITDDFSFSVLKILNVGEIPAQFGFRYRIDENFVLRGSTNFEDESRGVLEYELRF
jgi:translocation and assembly module TamB